MERLLLLLFLFMTTAGLAQPGDTLYNKWVENNLISGDSISIKPGTGQTAFPVTDSGMVNEEMESNVSNLQSLQKSLKAREAKEKRNAMFRIGIGIVFLIILIIGLRRKAVKK